MALLQSFCCSPVRQPVRKPVVWMVAGVFCVFAGQASAERWTSLSGSHTVEADFVGLWGDQVVLEMPGQRRVTVALENLIAESRIQARRMAEADQQRRSETKQQILAEAEEAAAPAPTPLPQPPAAPAYTQPTPGGSVLAHLEWVDQQKRNGHAVLAAFDALPPKYRSDIETRVQMSARQMDLQTLGQTLASVQSIGDLIVTRQRWLFSHPRLETLDPGVKENIKGLLLGVAGTIRDGLDPQHLNLDALADQPLRSWLAELDQRVAPHLAQLYTQMDLMGVPQPAYEVKGERDGQATVEMSVAETKLPMQFVSVDGFWVPADLAEESWKEKMTQWDQSLGESAGVPQTAMMALAVVPTMVESSIQPALAAESARDFHAVMDGWIIAAAPWVSQLSNLDPLSGRRGRYGGGYGEMMGMEGDMMEMEAEMMEMEMEAGAEMEMEGDMMESEGMQER